MTPIPVLAAAALAAALAGPHAGAAPHTYRIDPEHTYPSIAFPHMGISVWRGKFNRSSGTIVLDREARTGNVDVRVDTDSIDFGLDSMHEHARAEGWFDVARFPEARYTGTIRFDDGRPAAVDGELTVRGVTRPLTLRIAHFACKPHPLSGKEVCGADAHGALHWSDFGMRPMEERSQARVELAIQVEAVREE